MYHHQIHMVCMLRLPSPNFLALLLLVGQNKGNSSLLKPLPDFPSRWKTCRYFLLCVLIRKLIMTCLRSNYLISTSISTRIWRSYLISTFIGTRIQRSYLISTSISTRIQKSYMISTLISTFISTRIWKATWSGPWSTLPSAPGSRDATE